MEEVPCTLAYLFVPSDLDAWQVNPGSSVSIGSAGRAAYLYFDRHNIISGVPMGRQLFRVDIARCPASASGFTAITTQPVMPLDPRPTCGGSAFQSVTSYSDSFIDAVTFKGAFGEVNWLDGWSIVNQQGGFVNSTYTCAPADATPQPVNLCGESAPLRLLADITLTAGQFYILSCQLVVPAGNTLVISAGVTIYATPDSLEGAFKPPAIIVEKGGFLIADGTAEAPITFTALNPGQM